MNKLIPPLLAALLAATAIAPAHADWGRHRDFRPPARHHHHHHHHREDRAWIGPAAVLAITGLAIGAAAYGSSHAAPAPVYAEPVYAEPVYVAPVPAGGTWYYCGSSDMYYPYTNACPEGWQAVPAR